MTPEPMMPMCGWGKWWCEMCGDRGPYIMGQVLRHQCQSPHVRIMLRTLIGAP